MIRPVLILGLEPRVSVPVARSLHRHGIPVEAATVLASERLISSRALRNCFRLPDCRSAPQAFAEALGKALRDRGFDTVIPVTDAALEAVSQHYSSIAALARPSCPSPAAVARVLSKTATLEAAQRAGLPTPRTFHVASAQDLERAQADARYPVILKPARTSNAVPFKSRFVRTGDELERSVQDDVPPGEPMLLQEFCEGSGLGIEVLVHNGEVVACFQHRRLKEYPPGGGGAVLAIAEKPDPVLVELALRLLRELDWEGVAMVEFRFNPADRSVALMEVNGRYWGTVSLPIQAGIDFPLYEWQLAHDQRPQVPDRYRVGMRWRWTPGYLKRLHQALGASAAHRRGCGSRPEELAGIFRDFGNSVRNAVWDPRDPAPAAVELGRTVISLIAQDARTLARAMLPASLRRALLETRDLSRKERRLYWKLRLGLRRTARFPADARSVLFVCRGNIIRSVLAAELLRKYLANGKQLDIDSAGLGAQPGRLADRRVVRAGEDLGLALEAHRARLVTSEMVAHADAIVVMDLLNATEMLTRFPASAPRLVMMSSCAPRGSRMPQEIPDPYNGSDSDVRRCCALLDTCVRQLAKRIDSLRD